MNCLDTIHQFKMITNIFGPCSLVNAQGQLLYSREQATTSLCTTRLVAFQIVKKYLHPKAGDLFILNDPENGGFQFDRPLFIAGLNSNLFLIWDASFSNIHFKIPPTPLYDSNIKNEFVWQAMISAQTYAVEFEKFILAQKEKIDRLLKIADVVHFLNLDKNQQSWLRTSQLAFEKLFSSKANGSAESHFKINGNQLVKLKLFCEDKANLRQLTMDLSNTSLAQNIHAASHIIESSLINTVVNYYHFDDFFTQAVLDRIKIIVPPRSIVSKAHPTGAFNYDLQHISEQMLQHNLMQLNTPSRKTHHQFENSDFLCFSLQSDNSGDLNKNYIAAKKIQMTSIEKLIGLNCIQALKLKRADSSGHLLFEVLHPAGLTLKFFNQLINEKSTVQMKLNSLPLVPSLDHILLKPQDQLQIDWSF